MHLLFVPLLSMPNAEITGTWHGYIERFLLWSVKSCQLVQCFAMSRKGREHQLAVWRLLLLFPGIMPLPFLELHFQSVLQDEGRSWLNSRRYWACGIFLLGRQHLPISSCPAVLPFSRWLCVCCHCLWGRERRTVRWFRLFFPALWDLETCREVAQLTASALLLVGLPRSLPVAGGRAGGTLHALHVNTVLFLSAGNCCFKPTWRTKWIVDLPWKFLSQQLCHCRRNVLISVFAVTLGNIVYHILCPGWSPPGCYRCRRTWATCAHTCSLCCFPGLVKCSSNKAVFFPLAVLLYFFHHFWLLCFI